MRLYSISTDVLSNSVSPSMSPVVPTSTTGIVFHYTIHKHITFCLHTAVTLSIIVSAPFIFIMGISVVVVTIMLIIKCSHWKNNRPGECTVQSTIQYLG